MPLTPTHPLRGLAAALLAALPALVLANVAEIVSLTGKGETRPPNQATWSPAKQAQKIDNEHFVRTGDLSAIALMFADKTQLRLAQNSMFQVKAPQGAAGTNTIDLRQGRAWSQTKGGPGKVAMQTPSAIAAIQGTDWEMEVDEQGRARLTVLHGEVRFYNEQGSVTVRSGEQGLAEIGRAPTKQILQNPAERIQWVSDFRIDASRLRELRGTPADALARQLQEDLRSNNWPEVRANLEHAHAQGIAPAWAYVLLSDIAVYAGAFDVAEKWLATGYSRHPQELRMVATQARLMVMQDRADGAAQLLADTLAVADAQRNADDQLDLLLAQGDVARFTGDALLALRAFEAATRLNPADARGWLGWGAVAGERDEISLARARLAQAQSAADAIQSAAAGSAPLPQESLLALRAMAEVQANQLQAAQTLFDAALAERPDDYVALTGLGLLHLKAGRSQDALDAFLRAGVIEPRYARAVIYSAVAYHQLGQRDTALQTLQRARSLDKLDPLPYQIAALIQGEQRDLNAAIDSAREALRLLPYVRSLNPIANDQRGSANLGAALAAFGLEDWALSYAQQSYSPFAASSHLFLADRYSGRFNKQSELLQGYLTDPTAFGAVGRVQPLIAGPGAHASTSMEGTFNNVYNQLRPRFVVNGFANEQFPLAWFADVSQQRPQKAASGTAENYSFAVGAQPLHNFGLFAFANSVQVDVATPAQLAGLPDAPLSGHDNRVDAGANFKFGALNQGWLKFGGGTSQSTLRSAETPTSLRNLQVDTQTRDLQWRHTIAWDIALSQRAEFSWGIEAARASANSRSLTQIGVPVRRLLRVNDQREDQSQTAYAQMLWPISPTLKAEGYLGFDHSKIQPTISQTVENVGQGSGVRLQFPFFAMNRQSWLPRAGVAWVPTPSEAWRVAYQRWRKPVSGSTLGPVTTAGIALDGEIIQPGGMLERIRLQHDRELAENTFLTVFVDARHIENPGFTDDVVRARTALSDLDRLRQRGLTAFNSSLDTWDVDPLFQKGRMHMLGASVNHRASATMSVTGSALFVRGRRTEGCAPGFGTLDSCLTLTDEPLPYIPAQAFRLGLTWLAPQRWVIQAQATYTTSRNQVQAVPITTAPPDPLRSTWDVGLRANWESSDRKWLVDIFLVNLAKRDADSTVGFQLVWRH